MKRRFRPVIGPGLVIALALSAFYVWRRMQPPQIERPVVVQHEGAMEAAGVPDPPFVLEHAAELGLTEAQHTKVARLAGAYAKGTKELRKGLDEAAHAMNEGLGKASDRPASLTDIPEASRGVAELSGLLAEARAQAWPGLCAVLSEEQQQQAKAAWAKAHTIRPAPPDGAKAGGG